MIKHLISKLIPPSYNKNPSIRKNVYKWLLVGLLIRYSFMPIAFHGDFLAVYGRSLLIARGETIWPYWGQAFIHYIHAFFLLIFKPLMPHFDSILCNPNVNLRLTWGMFYAFVNHPNVFRSLFLFKVPYLIFDIGCAFLLLNIFEDCKKGLSAFKFWMLNPIVIFIVYICAKHESVAIFFILSSLYLAKKKSLQLSLFFLGLAIITRLYPLILLPFFVVILGKGWKARFKLAFWGLLPWGIITGLAKALHQTGTMEEMMNLPHTSYLLKMNFSLGLYDKLFIFVLVYTLLLLYTLFKTNYSFKNLWKTNLILLLSFFATCFFHPQYFMWLIPFLALQVAENKKFTWLFLVQVLCFIIYTFQWKKWFAGYLFTPLSPSYFMHLKSPFEVINQYYPASTLIGISRTIFSGICLWMIYLIFKNFFWQKKEIEG